MDIKNVKTKNKDNVLSRDLSIVPTPFDIDFPDGKNLYDKIDNIENGLGTFTEKLDRKSDLGHTHEISDLVNESGDKIFTNSEVISRIDETIFDKYTKAETEELINNKKIYIISDKLPDTASRNSNLLYFKRCSKYNNAQIVEMQSGDGLIYHPYTNSDAVIVGDNTLTDIISEIKIEEDKGTVGGVILLDNVPDSPHDKYKKSFLVKNNNNTQATTINNIPLYKTGGTDNPTLKAGKVYTVWYSEANKCFFLCASAEGTATPAQVLAGYTFSNDDDSGINGAMINRSGTTFGSADSDAFNISKNMCLQYLNNEYVGAYDILIPEGYYDGKTYSRIHIPNLLSKYIIEDAKIGWANGYIKGTIPNRGVAQYTDNITQANGYVAMRKIPWGYYPENNTNEWAPEIRVNNSTLASAIGLTPEKLLEDYNICGVQGTARLTAKTYSISYTRSNTISNPTKDYSLEASGLSPELYYCYSPYSTYIALCDISHIMQNTVKYLVVLESGDLQGFYDVDNKKYYFVKSNRNDITLMTTNIPANIDYTKFPLSDRRYDLSSGYTVGVVIYAFGR